MTGKRRAGRDPVPPPAERPDAPSAESSAESTAVSSAPPPVAPPASASRPTAFSPRQARRQARLERRRARRRRIGALGVAVIVVVVAIVAGVTAFGVHKAVTHHSSSPRKQTTLLLQLQASDRTAATSVLLVHDSGAQQGLELLVPSSLESEVCGYGTEPFGQALGQPNGVAVSRQTLSAQLDGVTIDGSWVLTAAQLAALVDKVHGITVAVDTNVVQHTVSGNELLVPQSPSGRLLTGAQAAAYATYVASSTEDQSAQLARTQQVVDALIRKLPTSTTDVASYLRGLGSSAQPTIGATRAAQLLVGMAADDRTPGGMLPTDLPVDPLDTGGAPAYNVDAAKTSALVHSSLAASLPKDSNSQVSIELLNGVGTVGLVPSACQRLVGLGYTISSSGNASPFEPDQPSQVQVPGDSQAGVGDQVAKALGLSSGDVVTARLGTTVADVVVVLGKDYRP